MAYPAKDHTDPNLTDEQIANCRKLAAYLRTLPADYPDFEMSNYTNEDNGGSGWQVAHVAPCGTAACAAGHGPRAGILPNKMDEDWDEYSERAFAPWPNGWLWVFAFEWSVVDNTAHGAAARIEYMLDQGVPKNDDRQRRGIDPVSYRAQAA